MSDTNTPKIRNFDHASATPMDSEVAARMCELLHTAYANPSGIHHASLFVRKLVEDARAEIAAICGVRSEGVIFTASATESDNLALVGAVRAFAKEHPDKTPHVVVSEIEHSAVLKTVDMLADTGVEVSTVPVASDGRIDPDQLREVLRAETVIVSVMYANNEIGTVQPIADIAQVVRWHQRKGGAIHGYPYFHVDATQAACYLPLDMQQLGVDLLTINGSKVYGPRGVGALVMRGRVPLEPILHGGAHESGLRPGTLNAPAIVGFSEALKKITARMSEESQRLEALQAYALSQLQEQFPAIQIHGSLEHRLPNNINFTIPKIDGEQVIIELDARGVLASSKSACTDESEAIGSHVLRALYGSAAPKEGSVRLSMGHSTTKEDIDYVITALTDIVAKQQLVRP